MYVPEMLCVSKKFYTYSIPFSIYVHGILRLCKNLLLKFFQRTDKAHGTPSLSYHQWLQWATRRDFRTTTAKAVDIECFPKNRDGLAWVWSTHRTHLRQQRTVIWVERIRKPKYRKIRSLKFDINSRRCALLPQGPVPFTIFFVLRMDWMWNGLYVDSMR